MRVASRASSCSNASGASRVLLVVIALVAGGAAHAQSVENGPVFEPDVRPIFEAHCFKCHSHDDPQAGLDLSTAASVTKGSDEGAVLIPGSADESTLLEKIASGKMPPPEEKDPLGAQQVAIVRRWIEGGARSIGGQAAAGSFPRVSDEDRAFWAFRPPVAPAVPVAKASDRVRTPIDAFLLARLEAVGLTFSPDASKPTLLRRAYLDLLGLPPGPRDVEEFLADTAPDAYERLLDRLLQSPQYGERWGRHWLDCAGYTDSPHCDVKGEFLAVDDWRYRDYVVRALNDDKPYDRFLREQLAGDELVDWAGVPKYTPEIVDALVATGYLRTTPDWTHGDQTQDLKYKYDTIARVVENVSTGVMGLTMGCARCHSHKFDPIPQQDFYRLLAVFASAYNLNDWRRPVDRYLPDVSKPDQEEIAAHNAHIDAQIADHEKQLNELQRPRRDRLFAEKLAGVPEALRDDVKKAVELPAEKRDEVQRYLAAKFEAALKVSAEEARKTLSMEEQSDCAAHDSAIAQHKASKRSFGCIQALFDVGSPPAVRQLKRGDAETPGPLVEPGFLTVLCRPGESAAVRPSETKGASSGRRLALANWLTGPEHPLTARVMMNRIWQHHFGKGIVATPENFGRSGAPPTHPDLLDWLAVDLREHGWKIKRLHRMIMTSTAYRQSAARPDAAPTADPDNDLLWRMNLRRLEAEAIRDAVLAVSGKLDTTMGGAPIAIESHPDGIVTVSKTAPGASAWRRSIYLRALRGSHPTGKGFVLSMMEIFDFPEVVINCTRRASSTTPLQSLALVNSDFMTEQARFFAQRVRNLAASAGLGEQIETAFVLALTRRPTAVELDFCQDHVRAQTQVYRAQQQDAAQAAEQALASLCLMLLASNEFLYIP